MARPNKRRCICSIPKAQGFTPSKTISSETIVIGYDEYEVLRLLDYAAFTQAQCAARMNVSRPTVARMYASVRKKIADAFVNGKQILFAGGDVTVCTQWKPECANEKYCCHRIKEKGAK